jgi:hypothetical protein
MGVPRHCPTVGAPRTHTDAAAPGSLATSACPHPSEPSPRQVGQTERDQRNPDREVRAVQQDAHNADYDRPPPRQGDRRRPASRPPAAAHRTTITGQVSAAFRIRSGEHRNWAESPDGRRRLGPGCPRDGPRDPRWIRRGCSPRHGGCARPRSRRRRTAPETEPTQPCRMVVGTPVLLDMPETTRHFGNVAGRRRWA